jgi:hypothetical protein
MGTKPVHSIYILADSYGGERIHGKDVDVSKEQTYPQLLKNKFKSISFSIDAASFRKITDFPHILDGLTDTYDLYVLQGGIVDCYPRPLSQKNTISQSFLPKVIRRVVRTNRSFFIKNIRNRPWSSKQEVENALVAAFEKLKDKKVLFVNIAPVNSFQNKQTPNANKNIDDYNLIIKNICKKHPLVTLVDVNEQLKNSKEMESFMHNSDSHLNIKGNILYADMISKHIQ